MLYQPKCRRKKNAFAECLGEIREGKRGVGNSSFTNPIYF